MIISTNKSKLTLERLAIENYFLTKNVRLNIKEINKRLQKLKTLKEIYELEKIIQEPRKIFAFEIDYKENDKYFIDREVQDFVKNTFEKNQSNKIKKYLQLQNFIYIKVKYNIICTTKEYQCGIFDLRQINPKYIIKKQKNEIQIDEPIPLDESTMEEEKNQEKILN